MTNSPIQSYLLENLPLAARPWLVASLRQDNVVSQAATDLLTYNFSASKIPPVEEPQAENWTPASLALRIIAPSIDSLWLRTNPMPDLDEELKKQAIFIANSTPLPAEDWSLEKAGWIALAIRSEIYAKESWESILDTWFGDPEAQHGTVLACLYGMISDSPGFLRALLKRNPSAQNIAIVLHALLANPLAPESQFQQLNQIINGDDNKTFLPISARLVILHILQSQRPQLAQRFAHQWLGTMDQYPTKVGWTNQDPLTWFDDLQVELFRAATRQIVSLEPASVTIINEWKKSSLSPAPEQSGILVLSDLIATASTHQLSDPQQALHYGQKASQYLTAFLKKIPHPLLADSRLVPLMQELSELFLALGQPLDSEAVLTLACELQPVNSNLLILGARSKQKSDKTDAAIQLLATALTLTPQRIDISSQLAESLETAGNWQAALTLHQALLEEALSNDKPDPRNELYALAKCALRAHQAEKAIQVCQQLLEINPEDGMAYYYQGQALSQTGKISEAYESLTKATQLSFDQPLPWLGLAQLHQSEGNQEQALATLQAAAQAVSDSPEIYLHLGEMHLVRSSFTQAEEALSQANQLAPSHPKAAYLYAAALQQMGHQETAKIVLNRALVENPDDQQLAFAYAQCLMVLAEHEQALPYLEFIISTGNVELADPYIAYAQVLLTLAERYPTLKYQPEKAVQALQKAIQFDPDNHRAFALLAEALAATQNHPAALEIYQKVLDTSLLNDPAWSSRLAIGMGRTALALGKPEVAIASMQDVIQNDPEELQPYRLLAEAYLAAHLPENALRAAQSAILLRDDDPQTITWVGPFIKRLLDQNNIELSKPGNNSLLRQVLEDSIHTITEIIQVKPDQIGHAISLSELQNLAGDPKSARQSLIAITHSDRAQSPDLIKAAEHLFALEDTQSGINCLKRAVDVETANQGAPSPSSLIQLAKAYSKAGSLSQALEAFDQAIQLEPANILHHLAKSRLLLASQQTSQALECLQLALQANPSGHANTGIHYMIATSYLLDGNLPTALLHAQQALSAHAQSSDKQVDTIAVEFGQQNHPIALYTLAAELSRSLLQPDTAQKFLVEGRSHLSATAPQQPEYIAFYCLINELSLEAGGEPVSNLEPPAATEFASKNVRLLSLNARLAYLKGELGQAQEFLKIAHKLLETAGTAEQIPAFNIDGQIDPIPDYLAFAEAALELREWDFALNCLRNASQHTHTSPLVHLAMVRFYTLQAEYQQLCQICDVLRHSPGPESISEFALRGVRNALASMQELFNGWHSHLEKMGLPGESQITARWQARADMVFEKQSLAAIAIQKLSSFTQDQGEHPYLYNEGDTSAIIAASRRYNGLVDEKINLAALFQMARKQSPNPALLLQIAISLTGHHQLEALNASQLSTKYLESDRRDISALCHYYQAKLYAHQEMYLEAHEKLDIALSVWNDEPRWNSLAAEIKNQLGDVQGAIAHLEEAVKYEPKNIKHHLSLGRAYLKGITADSEADAAIYQKRAIRNLERATRLAPQDTEAWLALAQAQYQTGDLAQAGQSVDQALEIDQTDYGALSLKAEIALRSDDLTGACDYAKRAALQQPDRPAAHLIHARALESLDRPGEALQALEKALPNSDNPLPLQLEHAGLVKQLQGQQAALEELRAIALQFPDEADVYVQLAKAYAGCDQDGLAIQAAQKSLASNHGILAEFDQAKMHHLLGYLLRKSGQLDQAIVHLRKAIQQNPDDVEPYLELGIAYKERREYQQALQLFQQATTIAAKDPRPFYQAGLALKEGKDYRRSEVMLRKAANLAPQDVNIRRQLAAVVALNLVHNPSALRANIE